MSIILKTEDLCKYYGEGENIVKAVDRVNLEIRQGEFTAIVGKSGSGKSTLLHMLGGLDRPTKGRVLIRNVDIYRPKEDALAVFRRRKIGFVFQAYNLVSTINVWENIVLPLGLDGRRIDEPYINELVDTLGLRDRLHYLPHALSGGQQQRVAIARALAARPDIVLADEPTGNLDTKMSDEVITLLKTSAQKFGQTLILITHDEDIAQMADRTVVLEDGRVIMP
ncbi:MAG TPA: ABC transporter ATP-binding protein [Candidatus Choladousia intestinipullorum]|nr:ABC transporter ATP-binding protein [Candidatus Choladousia intestinipullorum]